MRLSTNHQLVLIYKATKEELETFMAVAEPNGALLDIGTGGGRYARSAHELGFSPVYGLDIDEKRIAYLRRSGAPEDLIFLSGDILNRPGFKTEFGTIVMMTDTFNFLPQKERVLEVCRGLLKRAGYLYVSLSKAENARALYEEVYGEELLRELEGRGLSQSALAELLRSSGFSPELTLEHTSRSMFITRAKRE